MAAARRPFRLKAQVPRERDIHEACAAVLDRLLLPPAFWFAYPAGASILSAQQQARHTRIGLKRGLPDLWFLYRGVWLIELKRPGGRLSKTKIGRTAKGTLRILVGQEEMFPRLDATGAVCGIAICHSVTEVLSQLKRWGLPMRDFNVISTGSIVAVASPPTRQKSSPQRVEPLEQ